MKEKFKKLARSRMTYAVLLSMLVVGVAAAGAATLSSHSPEGEDPYLALEETATPITYGDGAEGAEVAVVPTETVPDGAPDEETVDAYETVDEGPVSVGIASEDLSTGTDVAKTETTKAPKSEAAQQANSDEAVAVTPEKETQTEETEEETKKDGTVDTSSSDVTSFTDTDSLSWPIEGEVIREFSMDTTVYYSTLDAYKVSPSMLIQGTPGMSVQAAAAGIVMEIGENEEIGKYVVMDLGNHYELTYGQLADIRVIEGELVEAGTSMAVLAEPTKYYVREGCNLYFMMTKEDTAVDPLDYLQ